MIQSISVLAIVSDYFRRYRGRVMMGCMIVFALGWLLVGISPAYPILICGLVAVAVAGSVWHLPSVAELGLQFSKTRGTAMGEPKAPKRTHENRRGSTPQQ